MTRKFKKFTLFEVRARNITEAKRIAKEENRGSGDIVSGVRIAKGEKGKKVKTYIVFGGKRER